MQKRYLGKGKLAVSPIGLGCMGMSMGYGPSDDEQSIKTLHHAIDVGMNFLDTSDLYGDGHNEKLIGRALATQGLREKVVLATKCGFVGLGKVDGSPAHIKAACDLSLQRLGVEVIDLFYLHRADKNVPIEESVGAFADLIQAGKIRHIGLSEVSATTLHRASAVHPITALQSEYSLWERKHEKDILKACRELDIGFVAYSPLGRGFLSGKYQGINTLAENDFRRILPKFQEQNLEQNLALVDKIAAFAKEKGCTSAQLALAWILAQGKDIVPIPGTRSIKRLDENWGALEVNLSPSEITHISELMPINATLGKQYPDQFNFEV